VSYLELIENIVLGCGFPSLFIFQKSKYRNNVRYMEETPCKMPIKNKIKKE